MKWVRYLYAYTILRPLDFASGLFWEFPKQEYEYTKDNGNSFWDRWWNIVFVSAAVMLAFGRDSEGMNYSEKVMTSGAEFGKVDTNRRQQPQTVALKTEKVGAVRVGAHRQNRVKVIRDHRPDRGGETERSPNGQRGQRVRERVEEGPR
jgi:hypothetical protein